MDGRKEAKAGLRIAYSNQKMKWNLKCNLRPWKMRPTIFVYGKATCCRCGQTSWTCWGRTRGSFWWETKLTFCPKTVKTIWEELRSQWRKTLSRSVHNLVQIQQQCPENRTPEIRLFLKTRISCVQFSTLQILEVYSLKTIFTKHSEKWTIF